MAYIHEKGIIHRDIRCAKILLDESNICKLVDFGILKHTENIQSILGGTTIIGAPNWMSPEVIKGEEYGWKSDIWSFGCTLLEMLNTTPPHYGKISGAALFKTAYEDFEPSFPAGTSTSCIMFSIKCLQREPQCRPSAKLLLTSKFILERNDS